MYSVPFRNVVIDSFVGWLRATFWCHIVLRLYPNASDPGGPSRLMAALAE